MCGYARIAAGLLIGLATAADGVGAQVDSDRVGSASRPFSWRWEAAAVPGRRHSPPSGDDPAIATALSAILPGAGQHVLGQHRKWAYLALETVGWVFYFDRRAAGNDLRDQYRDFAWSEARVHAGPRMDGSFGYYETLSKWTRSGAFDADPMVVGLQPETDGNSYNGSIWALASRLYLPSGAVLPDDDPRYQRALDYYRDRAYGLDFLWDWTDTGGGQDTFGGLIHESDDRFRQATNALGVLIANHVVSAVDAYLSARGIPVPSEARIVPTLGVTGLRWTTRIGLPAPW